MKTSISLFSGLFLAGFLLAATTPAVAVGANQVFVVDVNSGPGTDFPSIEVAILVAGDGDVLLIRPGHYGNALVSEGLTLIADKAANGERPRFESISVTGIAANATVVLRGLSVVEHFQTIGLGATVRVSNCAGSVVIEDVEGIAGQSVYSQPVGAWIVNSPRVTLTRCTFAGAPSVPQLGHAARVGLVVQHSTVTLYETDVSGGDGADAVFSPPFQDGFAGPGGDGVSLVGSTLIAVGSSIRGGAGGDGLDTGTSCRPAADGGDGLVGDGAVVRNDTVIAGGAAGTDPTNCPSVGMDGVDIALTSGQVQAVNETVRSYHVESPIRVGQPATTTYSGVPGEPLGLLMSTSAITTYFPAVKGTLLVGNPLVFVSLGVVPASGVLQFAVPVPNILPAGIEGIVVFEQVVVPGQSGFGLLSSPTAVVIIDASH